MSSEDEFKKRIIEIFKTYENRDVTETAFGDINNKTNKFIEDELTLEEAILILLDEAKKDSFKGVTCDSEKYEAYHILDEDAVINALLKWFGKPKSP